MGKIRRKASQRQLSSQEYEFKVSIRSAEVEDEINMREDQVETSLSYTLATAALEAEESQHERQVEDINDSEEDSDNSYSFSSFGKQISSSVFRDCVCKFTSCAMIWNSRCFFLSQCLHFCPPVHVRDTSVVHVVEFPEYVKEIQKKSDSKKSNEYEVNIFSQ